MNEEKERLQTGQDIGSAKMLQLSPLERARREREKKVARLPHQWVYVALLLLPNQYIFLGADALIYLMLKF